MWHEPKNMGVMVSSRESFSHLEVKNKIENMSDADWRRLEKYALKLASGLHMNAKDLLQDAFCRALDGRRKYYKDLQLDTVGFIGGIMKSLASNEIKKRLQNPIHLAQMSEFAVEDGVETDVFQGSHDLDTPENLLIAQKSVEQLLKAFDDNPNAQMILMAKMDGFDTPQEIQEFCEINDTQYQSALRAIRRKRDQLMQEERLG